MLNSVDSYKTSPQKREQNYTEKLALVSSQIITLIDTIVILFGVIGVKMFEGV
jgi:hypothetical protein